MTGQELVNKWIAFVRRFVSLSDGQALVVVLWAINTWVYDRFPVCPYLEIWAEHKRSGKSTLAEVLNALSRGGRILATIRVLSMVKMIEAKEGAYVPFIEEAERFWNGTLGDERSILASGYRRGAVHELEKASYRTFCPKAFVLIGNVHDILRDRCISIKLGRGTPQGNWTMTRVIAEAEADDLIVDLRDVMKDGINVLRTADGGVRFNMIDPSWLVSARDREIWLPIFSLAHALGLDADTLGLLKRASVDLSYIKTLPTVRYHPGQDEKAGDDGNAAEVILRDCVAVSRDGETVIPSQELVTRLHGLDEQPWRSWRGDGINTITLAALLVRFGISSDDVQVGKGRKERKIVKGYKVAQLRAALRTLQT